MAIKNDILDKDTFLSNVIVPIGETSHLTGATGRRIRSWTDKNYVETATEDKYEYGFHEVQRIALIQQMREWGCNLESAAKRAERIIKKIEEENQENITLEIDQVRISVFPMSSVFNREKGKSQLSESESEKVVQASLKAVIEDPSFEKMINQIVKERIDQLEV